jgi:proteasome lid subunit RPN8/RPN11
MSILSIPRQIFDEIVKQAEAEAPVEACGILAGRGGEVQQLYKMKNTDESNEHFMMEPKEQFAVVKDIRSRGLEMLAVYHSHPESPARPSAEDIRLAYTGGVQYVIVSLEKQGQPEVRAFEIENEVATESQIIIVEDT